MFYTQTQIGNAIEGTQSDEYFGKISSMSDDGKTLVIGSPNFSIMSPNNKEIKVPHAGKVVTYNWTGTEWEQKGDLLLGSKNYEEFGKNIKISKNGKVLVVLYQSGLDNTEFYIQAYYLSGSTWEKRGEKLISSEKNHFGNSIVMSFDGKTLAISSPNFSYSTDNYKKGIVDVYDWDGKSYQKRIGKTIFGDFNYRSLGTSIDMSSDGQTLAVCGQSFNNEKVYSGRFIKILNWSGSDWVQIGKDFLFKNKENHLQEINISLSNDGNCIAIGLPDNNLCGENSGYICVYLWNNTEWILKGNDLCGKKGYGIGSEIKLCKNGDRIVYSILGASDYFVALSEIRQGWVEILDFEASKWVNKSNLIVGNNKEEGFGSSLQTNAEGSFLVVGHSRCCYNNNSEKHKGKLLTFKTD
ncbi:MAG: hypothetical protein HYU67_06255 [Flavobacteriia bacterium]|nr:hypothetical protein [Flavobacteriia bacterium]